MDYYINAEKITLEELRNRIMETDLVPSRAVLLRNITENFDALGRNGYNTFADLRRDLKNPKNIAGTAKKTGIDSGYLTLLRREIESYFPKTFLINEFSGIPKNVIAALEKGGCKNTVLLFEALQSDKTRDALLNSPGIDSGVLEELSSLVNLTRIQWISPLAARMLLMAGYRNAESVAAADAERMCEELDRVNKENNYFKGKIGLRDVKRLIKSAAYVS